MMDRILGWFRRVFPPVACDDVMEEQEEEWFRMVSGIEYDSEGRITVLFKWVKW